MDPSREQEDRCWSKGARIDRSGGHIVGAITTTAGSYSPSHRGPDGGSRPQQGRRLDPPLDLSLNPTLVDAVRQLDGTGANGPRRPPAGAVRLRRAERPGSWPVPEAHPSGRPRSRTGLPRPSGSYRCHVAPTARPLHGHASSRVAAAGPTARVTSAGLPRSRMHR
jgi:hypothetical protein